MQHRASSLRVSGRKYRASSRQLFFYCVRWPPFGHSSPIMLSAGAFRFSRFILGCRRGAPSPRPKRCYLEEESSQLCSSGRRFCFSPACLEEVVPDWRPALWLVGGLNVGGTLAWCWFRGGFAWVRHFAFSTCFLFFAVPWPYQVETWLVQGLMRGQCASGREFPGAGRTFRRERWEIPSRWPPALWGWSKPAAASTRFRLH